MRRRGRFIAERASNSLLGRLKGVLRFLGHGGHGLGISAELAAPRARLFYSFWVGLGFDWLGSLFLPFLQLQTLGLPFKYTP